MKKCSTCQEVKEYQEFYRAKSSKDGYQNNCKECAKQARSAWTRTDKGRAYSDRNNQRTRAKDPEYFKEYHRNRYLNDAEYRQGCFDRAASRRALILNAKGAFTRKEFEELCDLYGSICLACGANGVPLEADHVIPISLGGANDISNIQPLCMPCNRAKRTGSTDFRPDFELE